MNKTFKVARSLTRGTVVTSEKASSYQGKAVKTVIAAAVASMVAGAAMAAPSNTVNSLTLNGAQLTVSGTTQTVSGGSTVIPAVVDDSNRTAWVNEKDVLATTAPITLKNAAGFNVTFETTADNPAKYNSTTLSTGTVTSDATSAITLTSRGVGDATKADAVANLSVTGNVDLSKGGSINFVTENAAALNDAATLSATGNITLGTVSVPHASAGIQAKLTADANSNAVVSGTFAVTLANVAIENAGKLAIQGATVSVGEESAIANSKELSFTATNDLTFDADYSDAGKLTLTGNKVTLGGHIKAAEAKFGVDPAATNETATVFVKATDTTTGIMVDAGSVQEYDKLTVGGKVTVSGDNTDGYIPGSLKVTDLVAGSADASINNTLGSVELGTVTVGAGKSLTVTNGTHNELAQTGVDNIFEASTLVVSPAATTPSAVSGKFAIASGTFTLTGTGSKNEGSITLDVADSKLVVAEGADFTNLGTLAGVNTTDSSNQGTVDVKGSVTNSKGATIQAQYVDVSGTLTNEYVKDANNPANNKIGTIKADELTVLNGGTVTATIATEGSAAVYDVANTAVEEGGTFVTTLNAKLKGDETANNALTFGGREFWLDGGDLTTASGAVENIILNANDSLYLSGKDYKFTTVNLADDAATLAIDESTVEIANLDAKKGMVFVAGTLNVTTSLQTAVHAGNPVSTYAINVEDGTLQTTLAAMNLKTDANGKVVDLDATNSKTQSVANGTINLDNLSKFEISGIETVAAGTDGTLKLQALAAKKGVGLIDLGAAKITGLTTTNGEITAKNYNDQLGAGITNDEVDQLTLTEIQDVGGTVSVGAIKLSAGHTQANVLDNAVVYLHNSGELVTTSDGKQGGVKLGVDSGLITDGTGAKVGAIDGASGFVSVEGGDLTVTGDSTVGDLEVVEGAALTMEQAANATTPVVLTVGPASAGTGTQFVVEGSLKTSELVLQNLDNGLTTYENQRSAWISGSVEAAKLTVTGTNPLVVAGNGVLSVGELAGGNVQVGDYNDSEKYADDPRAYEWERGAAKAAFGKVTATAGQIAVVENSYVSLGTTDVNAAEAALKSTGLKLARTDVTANSLVTGTVNRVVYVEGNKTAALDGNIAWGTAGVNTGTVFSAQDALVFDAQKVDTTGDIALLKNDVTFNEDQAGLYGEDFDEGAGTVVAILNAKNGDKYRLSAGTASGIEGVNTVFTGDLMMNAVADETESTLSIEMDSKENLAKYGVTGGAVDAAYEYFKTGANVGNTSSSGLFQNYMFSSMTSPFYDRANDEVNVVALMTALNSAAALGATTGVQTMTMDAVGQMADTVATRNSILTQRAQGVNVWADVNGGKFGAKKLFEGAGYSSDIYSGVLGLDYQFSCNAVLGAALTIGTADTDSKNSAFSASTDSDLVGFSVYASKTFADIWNVSADIGYLQASNEVKADGYGFNYKFDQDTDAFTVGVRGEVLTKAGSVNIVPHVGLRYTALSTDGFEAAYVTDIDDQNIFQMPVGVTVSADFETNGWTIAPKFDLSVVPTFGDKDADLKLGVNGVSATSDYSVRVIDSNPVQAQLGVNATNGAWGFGLSYKLGVGSDERQDNSFNAQVRYAF